ncbi:NADH-dependent [FeFe] hydrogenase, group A6 [Kiritimatiella glycovorans]|uniref:Fe-only hydrogenase subunit alpha n=1 Tax=Kiritimatiella glycovorans TaxID=1307763 RepID=A0A0G3EDN1_9BACT|nr:NADH-dependent [FeFe] hydrogenase, group A6 [Kiritimatiella glycovorans]AKJ64556.1 Fe-only hydrogenase subunit alpha [Kiritimatiella glycovorans]
MDKKMAEETSRAPRSQCLDRIEQPDNPDAIGAQVTITVDDQEIKVPLGTTILEAARELGIRIPTLCYHEDLCVAGVCRVCVVEVEEERTLQASCSYPVTRPITVRTHTRKVRQARRHILDLLLSRHYGECYACFRNNNCELQALAKEYGVDFFRFGHPEKPRYEVDRSSHSVVRDMDKCILCRRCVRTCIDLQETGVLEVAGRSFESKVVTFGDKPLAEVVCINCGQCINRCPTGALRANDPTDEVWAAIDDPTKHVVIQTAPSPRAGIGECFGLEPGHCLTFEMNTALRMCGFDKVFDTNFTADLTILEEGTELIRRLYGALVEQDENVALPQFTSCSPGWVKYIEHFYPEYLDHVSTAKSPQQMFGSVIKTYYAQKAGIDPENIVTVALMPCAAKKFECNRPEMCDSGHKDIDYGLTTRELAQMISETGIHLPGVPKSDFDDPFGTATGSGVIFGATGGVMESALRTIIEVTTGVKVEDLFEHADITPIRGFEGIRFMELPIEKTGPVPELLQNVVQDWSWLEGATLKVAVAHGTAHAKRVMEDIKAGGPCSQCHFIEFMACPGGCLGGGGQPIPTSPEIREARAQAIYAEDSDAEVRKSYENPAVAELYRNFFTDGPCSHLSHQLLHTHYTPRGKYIV